MSLERVQMRVQQKGHFVDVESIKVNFEQSRKNAIELVGSFENLMVLDGSSSEKIVQIPAVLAMFNARSLSYVNKDAPEWAVSFLKDITDAYMRTRSSEK